MKPEKQNEQKPVITIDHLNEQTGDLHRWGGFDKSGHPQAVIYAGPIVLRIGPAEPSLPPTRQLHRSHF